MGIVDKIEAAAAITICVAQCNSTCDHGEFFQNDCLSCVQSCRRSVSKTKKDDKQLIDGTVLQNGFS